MTTKNTARNAAPIPVPPAAREEPGTEPKGGWDAYEVWRTRVLLPRLESRLRQTNERAPQIAKRADR